MPATVVKTRYLLSIVLFSTFLFGCNTSDNRKVQALKLLSEVNDISRESSERMKSGNIQAAIARLDEYKKIFPEKVSQAREDAKTVKEFFEKEVVIDRNTEDKLSQVLGLGLSKEDADCITGKN